MIQDAFTQVLQLFTPRQDERGPVPTDYPESPWGEDEEVWITATQLMRSYVLRYVFLRHSNAVKQMRGAGVNIKLYQESISWQGHTVPIYTFFDTCLASRKDALQTCFFELTPQNVRKIRHMRSQLSGDTLFMNQARAVLTLMLAMVELRSKTTDLHGETLPAPVLEIMQRFVDAPPYHNPGNMNDLRLISLVGHHFFTKTADELDTGKTDPSRDQADEVAGTVALQALDWGLGPQRAYHVIGYDGNHFSLVQRLRGTIMKDAQEAVQHVTIENAQRAVLAEYLLSLTDRHSKNVLVDPQGRRLREIDFAGAFKVATPDGDHCFLGYEDWGSSGIITSSHARAIWEVHPEVRFATDQNPIFSRSVLEDVAGKEQAVAEALLRVHRADAVGVVVVRFAILHAALQKYSGDISLKDLESCREMF